VSRRLILTADDFGLDEAVNEAVERAHREGALTATSLMVGAPAARDAIARARRLPGLAVGLHVVLADGLPVLPLDQVGSLVGTDGRFADSPARAGVRYFFDPRARKELAAEIRAQFAAFHATGLPLDHVNGHTHLHIHPTILELILSIGREYGMRAMRLPAEPALASWRAAGHGLASRMATSIGLVPWLSFMRHRLQRDGIKFNDFTYGLFDTGAMVETLVLRQLATLPAGVGEMYFHPGTRRAPALDRTMSHYRHDEELLALTSPKLRAALAARDIKPIAFRDL
jgi:hopanoid biosynthesis associated protein HpnK